MKLLSVWRFDNGMVMAFNLLGEQVPECQGKFEDVKDKVAKRVNDSTHFYLAKWDKGKAIDRNHVSKTEWFKEA